MRRQPGFTLVEIICVLVILGFLGSFASVGIVRMIRLYSSVRDVDAGIQQAQIAMNRLFTEVTTIDRTATGKTFLLDASTATTYSAPYRFTSLDGTAGVDNTIAYDSSAKTLSLNGVLLCQNVTFFLMKRNLGATGVSNLQDVAVSLSITVGTKTQALTSQFTLKGM